MMPWETIMWSVWVGAVYVIGYRHGLKAGRKQAHSI